MHLEIRRKAVEFIREHREDFEPFIVGYGMNFEPYLELMKRENEWGGNMEMQAMSRLYQHNIEIHSYSNPK